MKWKIILPLLIALPAVIIAFNEESDGKVISFLGCVYSFSVNCSKDRDRDLDHFFP